MLKLTPVVKVLLIINVAVFLVQYFGIVPYLNNYFALYYFKSPNFQPFQILTHVFTHGDFSHLFHNMISVLFLAPLIEQFMGSNRFITFYMVCGLGASALFMGIQTIEIENTKDEVNHTISNFTPDNVDSYIKKQIPDLYLEKPYFYQKVNTQFYKNPNNEVLIEEIKKEVIKKTEKKMEGTGILGASGAVFGILAAFLLLFPNMKLMLLFLPFPIKAKYLISAFTLYEVYRLIENNPNDNVAHLAHLGGMLFAFIMIKLVWKIPRIQ